MGLDRSLRLLVVEGSDPDQRSLHVGLGLDGGSARWLAVGDEDGLLAALGELRPDLVVADRDARRITWTQALALARTWDPEVPFLLGSWLDSGGWSLACLPGARNAAAEQHLIDRLDEPIRHLLRFPGADREPVPDAARRPMPGTTPEAGLLDAFDGHFLTTPAGRIVDINRSGIQLLGYDTIDEVRMLDLARDVYADPADRERILALARDRDRVEYEVSIRRKDGSILPTRCVLTAIRDDSGAVAMYRGVMSDASDRKHVDEAVRASEASRLELAEAREAHIRFLENLDRVDRAIGGAVDLEQMMRDVLDELLSVFGCDHAWLVYPCDPGAPTWKPLMERTLPEHPAAHAVGEDIPTDAAVAETFRIYLGTPGPVAFGPGHDRSVPPDLATGHGIRSFLAMALRPRSGDPWVFGLQQCSHARTWTPADMRLFEEIGRRLCDSLSNLLAYRRLLNTEQRLRLALNAGTTGAFDVDLQTGTGTWTSEIATIIGVATDFEGNIIDGWASRIHPHDIDRVRAEFTAMVASDSELGMEFRVLRPEGGLRWVRWRGQVTAGVEGGGPRVVGVVIEVTDAREAAERLRRTEAQYRRIVDTSSEGIWVMGPEGETVFVNARLAQMLGRSAEEMLRRTIADCIPDEEIGDHRLRLDAGVAGWPRPTNAGSAMPTATSCGRRSQRRRSSMTGGGSSGHSACSRTSRNASGSRPSRSGWPRRWSRPARRS